MASIPKKVAERLVDGIKKYQQIVRELEAADAAEANTVILVTELLAEVFGYDKFKEITSEFKVKTTYCDLATKIGGDIQTLIEVKSIGRSLKDSNVRQAVNYAAHEGVKWVVLTNGRHWRAYSVKCKDQVDYELVVTIDFLDLDHKAEDDLNLLYLLCKEGWAKSVIDEYEAQKEALDKFVVAATILSEKILLAIKTELRRVSPGVHFDIDDIREVIENDVVKRELLEDDKADGAKKMVAKAAKTALRETTQ